MTRRIPGASLYEMRIPGVGPEGPEVQRDWPEYVRFITDALANNARSMDEVYRTSAADILAGRRIIALQEAARLALETPGEHV